MSGAGAVQRIYDELWGRACDAFAAGHVTTDPYLRDRAADTRRGISLIARPAPALLACIQPLLDQLCERAPHQHLYQLDELHITVLSLISVAAGFDAHAAPIDTYRDIFTGLFPRVSPFTVRFRGLTASPDSVMLCGYAGGDALNALRDTLREALGAAGLGASLDRRYRIITAHTTILRFKTQPGDLPGLAAWLAANRARDLGAFAVDHVDFVENDWFMSHDKVMLLDRYPLGDPVSPDP